jgi:hypothetical protein
MAIKNKKQRLSGYIGKKGFERTERYECGEYGQMMKRPLYDVRVNCELVMDHYIYQDTIAQQNDIIYLNDINRDKFYHCCEQGKLRIIHMLKDPDPEIREIAECLAEFLVTKELV